MNGRAYRQAYYKKNRTRIRKEQRRYYQKNRRKIMKTAKRAYRADPERKKQQTRESNYKKWYGITESDYQALLAKQGGKCFLCKTTKPGGRYKRMCIDHNHKTGKIRKLLCRTCNLGIGNLQENHKLLAKAAEYVRKHNGQ